MLIEQVHLVCYAYDMEQSCYKVDRAVDKGITLGESQGQNKLIALWNWLMASGRSDEAAGIMKPSNNRKVFHQEAESRWCFEEETGNRI